MRPSGGRAASGHQGAQYEPSRHTDVELERTLIENFQNEAICLDAAPPV
jgi:hypothetical protein